MSLEPRAYRRRETQVLVLIGLWVAVMAVVLWLGWPDNAPAAVTIIGPVGPIIYLFGPSVSVAVTPQQVIVTNTFHRWRIARSVLESPELDDTFLDLHGYEPVDIAALQTAFDRRTIPDAVRWFRTAMVEVGALPDDGKRRLQVHWTNVVILAVALSGWAVSGNYV